SQLYQKYQAEHREYRFPPSKAAVVRANGEVALGEVQRNRTARGQKAVRIAIDLNVVLHRLWRELQRSASMVGRWALRSQRWPVRRCETHAWLQTAAQQAARADEKKLRAVARQQIGIDMHRDDIQPHGAQSL